MSDETRTLRHVPDREESAVRRVVRTGLALAGLLFLLGLLAVLPGVDRLLTGLAVPPAALALAAGTLLVVAVTVADRGFEPAVTPTFRAFDVGGLYHLDFPVAGLAVLGALTRRLYHCREPVTRLVTAYVLEATGNAPRGDVAVSR